MGKTILLVEDEAVIAMQECAVMESAGFSVIHCFNGEEAIALSEAKEEISIILMDIDLGEGIDGTQTAEKILKNKNVPIVFLTSHNEKEMIDKVKNITRYGYVTKNSGQFVLIESINMALELFRAQAKLKKVKLKAGKLSKEYTVQY